MVMIAAFKTLAKVLPFTLLGYFTACWAGDNQDLRTDKTVRFIASSAKTIGGANNIGVVIFPDWNENPEVNEIASYESNKRIATIMWTISDYNKNEEKIFPNVKTDSHQLKAAFITRIASFSQLRSLTTLTSAYDVVIQDFLDKEIADLKLVLSKKISLSKYYQSREFRDNKRFIIILQDVKIVTEFDKLVRREDGSPIDDNIAQVLANKTFLMNLANACIDIRDLCVKL